MGNEAALAKALEEMKGIVPYAVASKSGCEYDGKNFRVPFFNRVFMVQHPEIRIFEEGSTARAPQYLEIILLHYLLQARGTPVADQWIAYRQLPGSALFGKRFQQMAVGPLLAAFGNDVESLRKAGETVGGIPISRTGDAAFKFKALPRINLAVIYFQGEEGIPASVNILFDAAAPDYLPTEDLSLLGVYLVGALKKAKPG
ncbi:MAG: DUF3786 domain-containing protein [Dehalococcoidia bacterium]|nr:DUF3786 domain-containing protein [Dehalococcoidia bacterium]